MEGEHPDLVLLRQALSGDRRARQQLVDRFGPLIDEQIRRSVPKQHAIGINGSDDFAQQVWMLLFDRDAHRLNAFDPSRGSLDAYISTIARNVIRDLLKAQNGRASVAILHEEDLEDQSPNAEERTAFKELAMLLRQHLEETLPIRGQLVLKLLYDDGRPEHEAAEIMGVSKQVVANWKHKIKMLAREFREKNR